MPATWIFISSRLSRPLPFKETFVLNDGAFGICADCGIGNASVLVEYFNILEADVTDISRMVVHRVPGAVRLDDEERWHIRGIGIFIFHIGLALIYGLLMRIAVFHPDILKGEVFYLCAVAVLNVHHYRVTVNEVAIAEFDIFHPRRARLGSDLEASAPVAPDNAILRENIGHGQKRILSQTLYNYTIVEIAQITVSYHNVLTVREITAVGVVSPHSDKLDVVNGNIPAARKVHAPGAGIDDGDALDSHVLTMGKINGTSRMSSLDVSVVEYTVAENLYILLSDCRDRAVDDGAAVDINGSVIVKSYPFTHTVNALAEVYHLVIVLVYPKFLLGINEDGEDMVLVVKFYGILTRTGQSDGYLAAYNFWLDRLGERTDRDR